MRHRVGSVVAFAMIAVLAGMVGAADAPATKIKPITAGPLTLNPRDIIAVYKPADGSSLGILIAKPGGAIQQIVLKDFREVAQTFNDLWSNADVAKDPGDDDAKPLTRMLPKVREGEDAAKRVPILLLNVDRILGIAWDSERRVAHVYVDRPAGAGGDETLEMTREEADGVVSAYKMCLVK
jgi:hypothetical protein